MDSVMWKKLTSNRLTLLSCTMLILMLVLALFAPWLTPHDPNFVSLEHKLERPSAAYWLGTDHLGRDILSRLIYGTRISLGISFIVMVLIIIISVAIGTLSGYSGGVIDRIFMRFCDLLMAFPSLILSLAMLGILGPGLVNVIFAMVMSYWVWYARWIRGMVMTAKQQNFILAAKIAGTPGYKIIWFHILPNIWPPTIVLATLNLGSMILSISGLSFLGLGIQPPMPEWGAMLNDSKQFLKSNPMLMLYPGLCIMLVVMAFNFIGDALRDALDPRQERMR
ncbi:nickel ABC transporter permease subunit NikC [Paenibacillus doosanensis]|uniref:Nickel transport system permease protein NikC n=2 Tax=Paenibacillus konkukensis TaxID=2020716 RepID=A0ABY4RF96_9BACL|nr:nickel ABC transporter permease subunit NikC [Paenibacillus doosanensis]MCS7461311.1 nickel ABC transporter permease subunit NikC [Paenibacillus doosanensis]UQZ81077.1 Nickel transport system permease protein NikC [Paenibacillus konkukensis]